LGLGRDGLLLVLLFVVERAEHAEAGVPAARVVEALDVPEDPESGLLAGREALASEQFFAEAGEEGLGDGVVPGSPIEPIERSMPDCFA
jgi:hypothetical protein